MCHSISRVLPPGSQEGITIIHYDTEWFSDEISRYIAPNVNIQGGRLTYDSFMGTGSFCPTVTGNYRFKVSGRRQLNIWFMNHDTNDLGVPGKCDATNQEQVTSSFYLHANKCYPIRSRMRTGCAIYTYRMQLYVSYEGGAYNLASNFISTEYSGCMPGYYGDTCLPPATPAPSPKPTPAPTPKPTPVPTPKPTPVPTQTFAPTPTQTLVPTQTLAPTPTQTMPSKKVIRRSHLQKFITGTIISICMSTLN
jgi:hypothetical protein